MWHDRMDEKYDCVRTIRVRAEDPRPTLTVILNATKSVDEALLTFQAVVLFNDFKPTYPFDMSHLQMAPFKGEVYRRLEYLNG